MSITQSIALHKKKLPSVEQVEAQAKQFGFDLKIDSVDIKSHTGFLPCKLSRKKGGFEWLIEETDICEDLGIEIGNRDCVCTMTTHGDEVEAQSAMVFAASLLELSKGVYFDDFDNVGTSPDPILEEVREWMKGGKK